MTTLILHGIPSCDTCRKALRELKSAGLAPEFRDIRQEPLRAEERAEFIATFGDSLLNRASQTWRGLSESERAATPDALLAAHPTLMKRPVIRAGADLHIGWTPAVRSALIG